MAETEATINLSSFIETLNEVNSQIQRALRYVLTMKTVSFSLFQEYSIDSNCFDDKDIGKYSTLVESFGHFRETISSETSRTTKMMLTG